MAAKGSWFDRHEFLIRRLHSLSGLVPVGAFMVVHLSTNSLILIGESSFQNAVFMIHSMGAVLPLVEWTFIFLPLIFHAVVGVWIVHTGKSNVSKYAYSSNVRYVLQRVTAMIALVFILGHVLHLHGWVHFELWIEKIAHPMGLARFSPYNAASTAAEAMQASMVVPVIYAIGILACVYHFTNGLWSMGITWGIWTSPQAQRRALHASNVFCVLLSALGLASIVGLLATDADAAREIENRMYEQRVRDGSVIENPEKRSAPEPAAEEGGDG